jgi:hypothetical protein
MTPTRDSLVWFIALGAALVAYLLAAEKPPTEWSYREWLQATAAVFAALSTKLQASPLPLSYSGQEKLARGEWSADVPPPAAAVRRRKLREKAAQAAPGSTSPPPPFQPSRPVPPLPPPPSED